MTKICSFIAFAMCLFNCALYSQSCPINIDFEAGDFSGWDCFTGTTSVINGKNIIKLFPSLPKAGVHEIIPESTPAVLDKYGKFPVHCPYGGKYSVKLGNDGTGSQAEGLSYTFQVPAKSDTFSLTYYYAVVLQDPNHNPNQQPRLFVTVYDVLTGEPINCASYDYVATASIPGFRASEVLPDVLYKTWSPVSIKFAGLAGRKVRLEFKTADCTLGGHFGYAYVDVASTCSNTLASAPYCAGTNSLVLNAPYGFQNYTWYNSDYSVVVGKGQTLTVSPAPKNNDVFHVDIIPYPGFGCRDTADALVRPLPVPQIPMADSVYNYCQYQSAPPLTATATAGNDLLWYTAEAGGTGASNAIVPATEKDGAFMYYVTQKILFGCESARKKIDVHILPTQSSDFTIDKKFQCLKENKFEFKSVGKNQKTSSYEWDFGDGQTQFSTDSVTVHHYTGYGSFNVKLKVVNEPSCSAEKTLPVTVAANPVASFNYPSLICEKQAAIAFKDNSGTPDGSAAISSWLWNIDGRRSTDQNPDSVIIKSAGSLPVQLIVAAANGCMSDTARQIVNIRYTPSAKFAYSSTLCDNEIIKFSDRSFMPANASTEYVARWHWQFSDASTSSLQHPSQLFNSGTQHARLVVESNYGCKSAEADSVFTIHAKPKIALSISDSCVLKTIQYLAIDANNTVGKWYWDFGNGLNASSSSPTKRYDEAGDKSVLLVGKTAFGCGDTLARSFIVYDNKAFAGRDTTAAKDEPVQLNAHGGSNVQYRWSPAVNLSDASIENPVASGDNDQLYQLDAMSDKGCESHSKIFIKRYKGPELYVPNAFSPNGDGSNDLLRVIPVGIKEFIFFAVYNRTGMEVYKTTDYTKGWDGTFRGREMDPGTYVVVSKAVDYKGRQMLEKTVVVLVR